MRIILSLLTFHITLTLYALPDCPVTQVEIWDDCHGTYSTFANGDKYKGQVMQNQKSGEGEYTAIYKASEQ